jgi:hypothetical protein
MTVTLTQYIHQVSPEIQQALRLSMKDAVNKSALLVTQDARKRVQSAIGAEMRLSGYLYNRKTGSRVSEKIIEAGGRRINPAYKKADSETKPVALIGARGPAHLIEHSRRGGYLITPAKKRLGLSSPGYAEALQRFLGYYPEEAAAVVSRAEKRRALALWPSGDFRAQVKGGAINRPQGGPITASFQAAPWMILNTATNAVRERVDRVKH